MNTKNNTDLALAHHIDTWAIGGNPITDASSLLSGEVLSIPRIRGPWNIFKKRKYKLKKLGKVSLGRKGNANDGGTLL